MLEKTRLAEAVIDAIKDPIFVKDAELRYVFVNEAYASLHGRRPREMLGRTYREFVGGRSGHALRGAPSGTCWRQASPSRWSRTSSTTAGRARASCARPA